MKDLPFLRRRAGRGTSLFFASSFQFSEVTRRNSDSVARAVAASVFITFSQRRGLILASRPLGGNFQDGTERKV